MNTPVEDIIFSRRISIKGKMPDYSSDCFLVGAFSLKEKSPTLTVSSFFQLTISLWVVHFSYNLFIFHICSSFIFIIFDQAGERGFDSRTKP